MINKQGLWFITLFSLILILGIYYATMPDNSLTVFSENAIDNSAMIEVTESDTIIAMKVEEEEKILSEIENARNILLDVSSSSNEKNKAYETLMLLNTKKGKVLEIEEMLKKKFNINSCVKIDNNKITITSSSKDEGTSMANKIINEVQSLYQDQMYITVKFEG